MGWINILSNSGDTNWNWLPGPAKTSVENKGKYRYQYFSVKIACRLWMDLTYHPLCHTDTAWWRHEMETFSALLSLCEGNSLVTGEFPSQMPVTRSFDIFFDLRPKKQLRKQWVRPWFETPSCSSLWRHCNWGNLPSANDATLKIEKSARIK